MPVQIPRRGVPDVRLRDTGPIVALDPAKSWERKTVTLDTPPSSAAVMVRLSLPPSPMAGGNTAQASRVGGYGSKMKVRFTPTP